MPTAIIKTIGSGGNYADLQSWANDSTAFTGTAGTDLVVANTNAIGRVISNLSGTTQLLNMPNYNTSPTNNILLTANPGQSFRDNAGVRTTALAFNSANGISITSSIASSSVIHNAAASYMTISNLQIQATGTGSLVLDMTADGIKVIDCILNSAYRVFQFTASVTGVEFDNVLAYSVNPGSNLIGYSYGSGLTHKYNFCTFVSPSGVTTPPTLGGVYSDSSTIVQTDCAMFGCGTQGSGGGTFTFVACATDATGTTGLTGGLTYASQFTNNALATPDFRASAGSYLVTSGVGVPVSGVTDDISGFTRNATHPNLGAWEVTGPGAAVSCKRALLGVGCSIGWRAALPLAAAWKLQQNPILTRRRLLRLR